MEFIRFGSSIPGKYWGCCACCVIQDFKQNPKDKASIQIVEGDFNTVLCDENGKPRFVGPTWEDIFWQRLRFGTFSTRDMPNHAFFAILTAEQISGGYGKQWLAILKKAGFEFIRTVDNSVYTGQSLFGDEVDEDELDWEELDEDGNVSSHPNYIFALFRNVGAGAISNPFEPPHQWTELSSVVPEAYKLVDDYSAFNAESQAKQMQLYKELPPAKWYTEEELEKEGVTITYAGVRNKYPQETKSERNARKEKEDREKESSKKTEAPFGKATELAVKEKVT